MYQKYAAIFAYFDSLLTGLTATPREEIDRNTYELFDREIGLPTDEYGLDQAVADRFLVPFRPISVPLRFPREGISYAALSDDEKAQWDLLDWDENVQNSGRVDSGAINAWLFAESTAAPETLSTRLFRSRLALIDTIDQKGPPSILPSVLPSVHSMAIPSRDGQPGDHDNALGLHRHTLADLLRCHVAACPADNFLVRPHLQLVERFRQSESWATLSPDDHQILSATVAPLPSAYAEQQGDTDADARRFDLLLYTLQLTLLRGEPRFARLQQQLRDLAAQLEARANIPQVAAELELIRDLLRDEWWQDVTVPMLEEVRRRLRALMGLIEPISRDPLYTNFADELGELRELDAAALLSRDEFKQFRFRALDFLRAHEDHLTMQRLRRNQPLTPADLDELQRFLLSHGVGTDQAIQRAAEECSGFGLFIRSLVGLDRNAAKELFADFLADGTYTATQIRFINEILDELTNCGVMDPARLYDPPFSDLAPKAHSPDRAGPINSKVFTASNAP